MNPKHQRLVLPGLLAAATLALTGCGAHSATEDHLPLGPISERMASLDHLYDVDRTLVAEAEREESIAACMKEQGFDYTPHVVDRSTLTQYEDLDRWSPEQFAKTYGYGISTWRNMPGAPTEPSSDDDLQVADPAYEEALWGTPSEVAEDGSGWLTGGCYDQATEQEGGLRSLMSSTVAQDIDNLTVQTDEDDTVVAALDRWSTCMADKGYDYKTPDDAQSSFGERLFSGEDEELVGDDLKALQEEEVATALADHQCGADLERARATVLARLETDYYDDHKTEVDAFFVQYQEFFSRD